MSLNKILLIGNAGRDPELRYLDDGISVTNFSLAVNSNRPDPNNVGEWLQDTEWFNVSIWGSQAESVNQYLTKGRRTFVEGRLSSREYTNLSGQTRLSLDVRATRVIIIDRKNIDIGDVDTSLTNQDSNLTESKTANMKYHSFQDVELTDLDLDLLESANRAKEIVKESTEKLQQNVKYSSKKNKIKINYPKIQTDKPFYKTLKPPRRLTGDWRDNPNEPF